MIPRWLTWIRRLFGIAPRDPAERVDAWLRELADQHALLDNTLARLRSEMRGAEHMLTHLDVRIAAVDKDIESSLKQDDRAHAASLALERQQLVARRPKREADVVRATDDVKHLERVRNHFLARQAEETHRLRELQRQSHTAELVAAVAEIDATIQTVPSHSYATTLLDEATARAEAERARLRVAVDLATPDLAGVHSTEVTDDSPSLIQSAS